MPLIPIAAPPPLPAGDVYNLSLYGIYRQREQTVKRAPDGCSGERGTYMSGRDARFSSVRPIKVQATTVGDEVALLPLGRAPLRLKGSYRTAERDEMEVASCADLNPDGTPRWRKRRDGRTHDCDARDLTGVTASVRYTARKLTFTASGGSDDPARPSLCSAGIVLPPVSRRVSARRLLAAVGRPVVLQKLDGARTESEWLSTDRRSRITVYVQLRKAR